MIPPQELQNKAFTRTMRGYDPAEVDEYINFVIEKYAEIYKQCEIYDKKLRIVSQKIVEIQDRENEIQNKEDTINKAVISSQKHYDRILTDAEEAAAIIIDKAEKAAEKVLSDARHRAQTALAAIEQKLSIQIESTQEKSDALLLSARTRCTKLLGDFKKEISQQRANIINLKNTADSFSENLIAMYKHQLGFITDSFYVPTIDFEKFTETKLFDMVMKELRSDAIDIAKKSGDVEYDFERELGLLRDTDFINEYSYKPEKEIDVSDGKYANGNYERFSKNTRNTGSNKDNKNNESKEEDVKVFPGKTADKPNEKSEFAGDTQTFDKTDKQPEQANYTEYNDYNDYSEEKPIATYDSDDYDDKNSNENGDNTDSLYNSYNSDENYSDNGEAENYNYEDLSNQTDEDIGNDEPDEEIEKKAKGFFGLFKRNKKKVSKSKNDEDEYIDENDEDEREYYDEDEDDEDDEEVMNIFSGLEEDE